MFAGIFGPSEVVLAVDPMTIGILVVSSAVGYILGHFALRALQKVAADQPQAQKN